MSTTTQSSPPKVGFIRQLIGEIKTEFAEGHHPETLEGCLKAYRRRSDAKDRAWIQRRTKALVKLISSKDKTLDQKTVQSLAAEQAYTELFCQMFTLLPLEADEATDHSLVVNNFQSASLPEESGINRTFRCARIPKNWTLKPAQDMSAPTIDPAKVGVAHLVAETGDIWYVITFGTGQDGARHAKIDLVDSRRS